MRRRAKEDDCILVSMCLCVWDTTQSCAWQPELRTLPFIHRDRAISRLGRIETQLVDICMLDHSHTWAAVLLTLSTSRLSFAVLRSLLVQKLADACRALLAKGLLHKPNVAVMFAVVGVDMEDSVELVRQLLASILV